MQFPQVVPLHVCNSLPSCLIPTSLQVAKLLPATQDWECIVYRDFTLSALNVILGVCEDDSSDEPMFKCLQVSQHMACRWVLDTVPVYGLVN